MTLRSHAELHRHARQQRNVYCYQYLLRGRWRTKYVLDYTRDNADEFACLYLQRAHGGNVLKIRRVTQYGKTLIWERVPTRRTQRNVQARRRVPWRAALKEQP